MYDFLNDQIFISNDESLNIILYILKNGKKKKKNDGPLLPHAWTLGNLLREISRSNGLTCSIIISCISFILNYTYFSLYPYFFLLITHTLVLSLLLFSWLKLGYHSPICPFLVFWPILKGLNQLALLLLSLICLSLTIIQLIQKKKSTLTITQK